MRIGVETMVNVMEKTIENVIEVTQENIMEVAEALMANVRFKQYDGNMGVSCSTVDIYYDAYFLMTSLYEAVYNAGFNPVEMFTDLEVIYAHGVNALGEAADKMSSLPAALNEDTVILFKYRDSVLNFPILTRYIELKNEVIAITKRIEELKQTSSESYAVAKELDAFQKELFVKEQQLDLAKKTIRNNEYNIDMQLLQ